MAGRQGPAPSPVGKSQPPTETETGSSRPLREIAALFLKLGFTAFGGPAAHLGLMHAEVVERRRWLSDQEFLDLLGATNLIPGPNSTEMAIHIGFEKAGWAGLLLAGACFIMPATVIVLGLAWMYVRFGQLPQAQWLLYGIKPVIIAIIIQAIWTLAKKAARNAWLLTSGVIILALYWVWHVNEIVLLFAGGLVLMVVDNLGRLRSTKLPNAPRLALIVPVAAGAALSTAAFSLPLLFLTFLKIGAVLYGSGYVLLAFLRADFVVRLHWLTDQQLLDSIAVGQVTPGPLFTSATFIGFLLGGIPGALLATAGIFLPSFVFVAISNPLISKVRASPWVSGFLDGVNIAALSLMTAVTVQLGQASLVDLPTLGLAAAALWLLLRYRINSTWLIAGGAFSGLVLWAMR